MKFFENEGVMNIRRQWKLRKFFFNTVEVHLAEEIDWKLQYWPPLWGKSLESRMSQMQQLTRINSH